ncbi:glycoside hydrolase superfamily [Aspergillus granulosus]|uniref:chitinase n=1 Tax=Aspergillus granulosus TaxID=176169 RepID=A0ABR4H761_9EURO
MLFLSRCLSLLGGFAVLQGAYAGLDLSSNSTVTVYWGQNSLNGTGTLAQQRLGYYCDNPNIDVIILAFLIKVNGAGGAPVIDFASSNDKCETFPGTDLRSCPEIGDDITACQAKNKTILLSIGGATYSEGEFTSAAAAEAGADLIWATFGPVQAASRTSRIGSAGRGHAIQAHRPFGNAVIDGFDFDFEAAVSNMGAFATKLRSLADADKSKKYYLTAAPQCPFPDLGDQDILNTNASGAIDAVWVQFYNNYCGIDTYTNGGVGSFNFETWDTWALKESKNPHVKVYLGVPANTGAATTGYLPISSLTPVIQYSKTFESFGGVMMWDVTQAYGNQGFLEGVKGALRGSAAGNTPGAVKGPKQQESEIPVLEEESVSNTSPQTTVQPQQTHSSNTQDADASSSAQQSAGEPQQNEDPPRPLILFPSLMEPDADLPWIEIEI